MLLDNQALFSDQQAITASAVSTNIINLGAPGTPPAAPAPVHQDIGGSNKIPVLIQVTEDFAGGTSLQVNVEMDDDREFGSAKVIAASPVIALAALKAGKVIPITVIPQGADQPYMRLNYTVVGTHTAGKITAGVSAGNQTNG